MPRAHAFGVIALIVGVPSAALAQPVIPGHSACSYASGLPNATTLAWGGSSGDVLFVGHEDNGSPTRIFRIGAGGGAFSLFGDTNLPDPDAVAYDATGAISGVPGSVLVGGACGAGMGCIWRVAPDQASAVALGPAANFTNVTAMCVDRLGRFLFTGTGSNVMVSANGAAPALLFNVPGVAACSGIAVDAQNRIYVACSDGRIRRFSESGLVDDPEIASGVPTTTLSIDFARGGPWGDDLYAIGYGRNHALHRINITTGDVSIVGTSFNPGGLAFGPDGALYVTNRPDPMASSTNVLRIVPCRANWDAVGCIDSQDFFAFLTDFFAGAGDYNEDGATNSQDLFDFLGAFFGGC